MNASEWTYLDNPFDNRTKQSFKLMYIIASDHFDKLKARAASDPQLQELYDFSLPAYEAFIKIYQKSQDDQAEYGYYTDEFERLMGELISKKVRRWDAQIMLEYDIDTSDYKRIMRGGRTSFQRGGYEMRLSRVKSLADTLGSYPTLSTVAQDVRDYSEKLNKVRSQQQGKEGEGQENSYNLEQARKELALIMHSILGRLIAIYFRDTSQVTNFYEMRYLRASRSGQQDADAPRISEVLTFSETLQVSQLNGKLLIGDRLQVTNTGGSPFTVVLQLADSPLGNEAVSVVLQPNESDSFAIVEDRLQLSLVLAEEETGMALVEVY